MALEAGLLSAPAGTAGSLVFSVYRTLPSGRAFGRTVREGGSHCAMLSHACLYLEFLIRNVILAASGPEATPPPLCTERPLQAAKQKHLELPGSTGSVHCPHPACPDADPAESKSRRRKSGLLPGPQMPAGLPGWSSEVGPCSEVSGRPVLQALGIQKPTLVRLSRLQKAEICSRVTRGWRPHSGSGLPGRCLRAWGLPRFMLGSGLCSGSAQLTRPRAWGLPSQAWGPRKVLGAGALGGIWGTKWLGGGCGVKGASGAVARASQVPPGTGGPRAWSASRGTSEPEPYQSSERSRGVPVGSIHSSPPGRQTRVGGWWLGPGRRARRNRRSASTAVVRRKRAASAARASMMGMHGPQGSGGHEAGSDAGGPSTCPGGCSGVPGIWRGSGRGGSTVQRRREAAGAQPRLSLLSLGPLSLRSSSSLAFRRAQSRGLR